MKVTTKIIAYYRVSTKAQSESGLGLEAQRRAVEAYAATRGAEIVGEFQDVESGRRDDRPQLEAALKACRKRKATLVIAKLDRLARSVHFISGLMQSGTPFDCCDRPGADPFRLHIEAAIAEEEARKISERTRAALASAKARGTLLGASRLECRNLSSSARQKGAEATKAKAVAAYAAILPQVREWREAGVPLGDIATRLNDAGHRTTSGGEFHTVAVHRLLTRD